MCGKCRRVPIRKQYENADKIEIDNPDVWWPQPKVHPEQAYKSHAL
jgi:hypothetical protein